jgi:hypothetical protein
VRHALAEALLDGLPRTVEGLCDLRPGSALRTSLFDCSALNLRQDLLHLGKRVEDHERLVARPDAEHRLPVATQGLPGRSVGIPDDKLSAMERPGRSPTSEVPQATARAGT